MIQYCIVINIRLVLILHHRRHPIAIKKPNLTKPLMYSQMRPTQLCLPEGHIN